jgi:Domain of unknown function (DUF4292)
MIRINFLHIVILISAFTLSNCKTSKNVTSAKPEPVTPSAFTATSVLKKMDDNNLKVDWMSGDVGTDYQGEPMNISANMNVRFRRDSVIWMNIKKLGFNVARAKITPDSIFVINYLQSSYIAQDLKYIERKFNLPANFDVLQNLMLGNPIFLIDKKQLKLEKAASGDWILRGSNEQWKTSYTLDNQADMLKEMTFDQPLSERKMTITYENYNVLRGYANDQRKFPYIRTLNVESPQTGKISITLEVDNDGLEVNVPKAIKFEIPAHYSSAQ